MDQPQPVPPSSDAGLYELVDLGPTSAPPSTAPVAPGLVIDTSPRPAPAPAPPAAPPPAETKAPVEAPKAPAAPRLKRKKPKRMLKFELPAWGVSLLVHVVVIGTLGLASLSSEVRDTITNLDASMVDPSLSKAQAEELTPILADPSAGPRDEAVGDLQLAAPGGATGLGTGSGPPSATPRVGVASNVGEGTSLPAVKVVASTSSLAMLPTPSVMVRDLGAGGAGQGGRTGVAGDVTYETKDIGQALDQLAREILRHLQAHKLTVIWLFDESGSMKDDQRAVKDKFDRITAELNLNQGADKKAAGALNHVIVGFGERPHVEQPKPTADISLIGKAIDRLKVDETGIENTMHTIQGVITEYGRLITKERRLLIVLVTDESGDDGGYVEEARQSAKARGVPIYVIGRQSLFGYDRAHLLYIDPVTKDHYWPTIRRGPESAGYEMLQYDGLHERWDEQPSGFAPYELARLAKDTGGIYFLLPSEENMRVRQREKAYSITTLKEYVPDYESRLAYMDRLNKSELRKTLAEIIRMTAERAADKTLIHRRHYPVAPGPLAEAIVQEGPKVQGRLRVLMEMEKKLRSIEKLRAHEPEKRWQAHYDLMLAQVATYQIKAYEYLACLDDMVALLKKNQLAPKNKPGPNKVVEWVIDHSKNRKAPKAETEKKYAEAERLLKVVIQRHPKTPWADLALDEMHRGFGCQRNEWVHDPRYDERAKLVPKY